MATPPPVYGRPGPRNLLALLGLIALIFAAAAFAGYTSSINGHFMLCVGLILLAAQWVVWW